VGEPAVPPRPTAGRSEARGATARSIATLRTVFIAYCRFAEGLAACAPERRLPRAVIVVIPETPRLCWLNLAARSAVSLAKLRFRSVNQRATQGGGGGAERRPLMSRYEHNKNIQEPIAQIIFTSRKTAPAQGAASSPHPLGHRPAVDFPASSQVRLPSVRQWAKSPMREGYLEGWAFGGGGWGETAFMMCQWTLPSSFPCISTHNCVFGSLVRI
jgi:hypothetical protein